MAQKEKENAAKKKRAEHARKRRLSISGKDDPRATIEDKAKPPKAPNAKSNQPQDAETRASSGKRTPPIIRSLLQT